MIGPLAENENISGQMKQQRPTFFNPMLYFLICLVSQPSVTIFLLFDRIFTFGSLYAGRYFMQKSVNMLVRSCHAADYFFMVELN